MVEFEYIVNFKRTFVESEYLVQDRQKKVVVAEDFDSLPNSIQICWWEN